MMELANFDHINRLYNPHAAEEISFQTINQDARNKVDLASMQLEIVNRSEMLLTLNYGITELAFTAIYTSASARNGNIVKLDEKFAHMPVIIGEEGKPVFLFQLVEEIDSILNYDELQCRFPELSYSQIVAGVGFLRTLSQFNSKNIDVDDLVDSADEADPEFQKQVQESLDLRSDTRVLATF